MDLTALLLYQPPSLQKFGEYLLFLIVPGPVSHGSCGNHLFSFHYYFLRLKTLHIGRALLMLLSPQPFAHTPLREKISRTLKKNFQETWDPLVKYKLYSHSILGRNSRVIKGLSLDVYHGFSAMLLVYTLSFYLFQFWLCLLHFID